MKTCKLGAAAIAPHDVCIYMIMWVYTVHHRLNNETVPSQQEELTRTLLSLVKELSPANPTAQPALSPLINGR